MRFKIALASFAAIAAFFAFHRQKPTPLSLASGGSRRAPEGVSRMPASVPAEVLHDTQDLTDYGDIILDRGDPKSHYVILQQRMREIRAKMEARDPAFWRVLKNRCQTGRRLSGSEYDQLISLIKSVPNDPDPSVGSYTDSKGKSYVMSDRSLLAMTTTAMTEAMGLIGKDRNDKSTENPVARAEYAAVMKVILVRMGNGSNDAFHIVDAGNGGAFNAWMHSNPELSCFIAGPISTSVNFDRAVRAFADLTDKRTKFVGFSDSTQYFADSSAFGQFNREFCEIPDPKVVLGDGTVVDLYRDAGTSPLHYYDANKCSLSAHRKPAQQ